MCFVGIIEPCKPTLIHCVSPIRTISKGAAVHSTSGTHVKPFFWIYPAFSPVPNPINTHAA